MIFFFFNYTKFFWIIISNPCYISL